MFEDYGYWKLETKALRREMAKQQKAAERHNDKYGFCGNHAQKRFEEARSELQKRGAF
jgi:hypothetical protein